MPHFLAVLPVVLSLQATDVLVPGKPAPAFTVDSFVAGQEFKALEPGKVHVVEFWATWCPPCVASIPHMTKLQKDNPDVRVVGVAGFERGPDPAANRKRVQEFVAAKGDAVGYSIAFDGDGSMGNGWMRAARRNGIPCAFVVGKDGTVEYVGSPDEKLDEAVKAAKSKPAPAQRPAAAGGDQVEEKVVEEATDEKGSRTSTESSSSSTVRVEGGVAVTETVTTDVTVEVKDGVKRTTTRKTTSRSTKPAPPAGTAPSIPPGGNR